LRDRLTAIKNKDCKLIFSSLENENFNANLQMVDSAFPLIISEYLIQYYSGNGSLISELTQKIKTINPCKLNTKLPHLYYEHKIKNFLTDIALGMTPATVWTGEYQATGGYIIVREDGEVLCYHLYNHNEFQEYLFKNTRFDTPSATRYEFGTIYKEDEKLFIKLNLQVRFI
jgi:type II restriction enzyme